MKPCSHFTLTERNCLQEKIKEGKSQAQIAREMNRDRSTIGREIKRNFSKKKQHYNAWRATTLYIIRRKKCVRHYAIQPETKLYEYIIDKLKKFWPPEVIAKRCQDESLSVATSTIYHAIHRSAFPTITAKTHLRRHYKSINRNKNNHASIKPEHTIDERPAEVEIRSRYGDFEGDTVLGAIGKGVVATMVDRRSRYLVAGLSINKTAERVREAINRGFKLSEIEIPVETITLDNGSEFAQFKGIESDLKTTIYFADPHSPWQRGTNENTNGILRFFYPKGTDFTKVTEEELQAVVFSINHRPRKCLGFLSPFELLSKKCCT